MPNITAIARSHFHVFALDLPGHGRSANGNVNSEIPDMNAVVEYWVQFIVFVIKQEEYKNLPRFFYGHSLGGTIGILVARRAKGLIFSFILHYICLHSFFTYSISKWSYL